MPAPAAAPAAKGAAKILGRLLAARAAKGGKGGGGQGPGPATGLILLVVAVPCLMVVALVLLVGVIGGVQQKSCGGGGAVQVAPSKAATGGIPNNYLRLIRQAGTKYGIDWTVIAGIYSIETDFGRLKAPGVRSGENFAGAGGPGQFLGPTWTQYGVDGNKDGKKDRYDPRDAIPGTANYLRASGGKENIRKAVFAYNHAGWYVNDVMTRARRYRGAAGGAVPVDDSAPVAGATSEQAAAGGGCGQAPGQLAVGRGNGREVLANKNITVYPGGQQDLRSGVIDSRVTGLLLALAKDHRVTVTSLKSGHSQLTASGNVSNHSSGRAVDIGAIDGVSCTNVSRGGPCGKVAQKVGRISGSAKASEVIFCFDPGPTPQTFALSDHCDHIHVGYGAKGGA
ncbi:MAG: lytic transglycosylase domain-containing protein [Actinomycetota bacterium]|nr:lytic transglycosylase domain-containing protein [Actinomycetota bacterium]